jgi:hypothetical protein
MKNRESLYDALKDPAEARLYLEECLSATKYYGLNIFLIAVHDVLMSRSLSVISRLK